MILYSLKLALANLSNRKGLTALTICAIAIGLALLTTMTTMSYQTNQIPVLNKSEQLHTILIDSRDNNARPIDDPRRTPRLNLPRRKQLNQ